MFGLMKKLLNGKPENLPEQIKVLSKDEIAEFLSMSKEALETFEDSYRKNILESTDYEDAASIFDISKKQTDAMTAGSADCNEKIWDNVKTTDITERIVYSLLNGLETYKVENGRGLSQVYECETSPITFDEIKALPEPLRPQLAKDLIWKDIPEDSYMILLTLLKISKESSDPETRRYSYGMFRAGLDTLDLDDITYRILDKNRNSIGNWLPELVKANENHDFFKIPDTTVIKVPLEILQLTRHDYPLINDTTKRIVNRFCFQAFGLDMRKEYFVKTGTASSKFDFRNCHVHGEKEVRELGEYLLYIHNQAVETASLLTNPCTYGMGTTNEWAVREFIKDKEGLPTIYKGLPLRCEYRVFIDCDTKSVIGMSPYWRPDVMKERFGGRKDKNSPHQIHDYITYRSREKALKKTYEKNESLLKAKVWELLPDLKLDGQWSLDIMQDGDDFYLIDMALADVSALADCVPKGLLKAHDENWIPKIS